MKQLGKIIAIVGLLTVPFLFYVHCKIVLLQSSYTIGIQNKILTEKKEDYRWLKYEVDQLKSPKVLSGQILHLKDGMILPKEVKSLSAIPLPAVQSMVIGSGKDLPIHNRLTQFLGQWISTAQAKPDR